MSQSISKVRAASLALYRSKGSIHAKASSGKFTRLRWAMVWLTQSIFYGACWLNWESNGLSRQAILFDISHEKFYFFDLVLWPQDALLLAFALILAATGLFLITAVAGRLFCGFACPQTIYTMIFSWLEAKIEGDHLTRRKLDQSPLNAHKLLLRSTKHGLWFLLAAWTAISFVGYFTPIRQFVPDLLQGEIGPWEGFWLLFYAAFTYVQAGLAREAVCQHMCPYSRFQGVMFDQHTRSISYDPHRGEPRHSRRQAVTSGDCINCGICVEVCPTGIDIRDGLQYQCINCGVCADACNEVMQRIAAPPGLIRFASEQELHQPHQATPPTPQLRPRIAVYAFLLLIFAGLTLVTLQQRSLLLVDVLRDRGALFRETSDGRIENAYTLKLMNLAEKPVEFSVTVSGIPGIRIVGKDQFATEAGSIAAFTLTLSAPQNSGLTGIQPIDLHIVAQQNPQTRVREASSFALP